MPDQEPREGLAANLEMLERLLKTLTRVLDIRGAFDAVSQIAGQVLRHDAMSLPYLTEDREHLIPLATAGLPDDVLPAMKEVDEVMRWLMTESWDFHILADLQSRPDPKDMSQRLIGGYEAYIDLGYRCLLRVPIRIDDELIGLLGFFSRTPRAFDANDALVARRIADHVALVISHQRLAEAQARAAALRERAENLAALDGLLDTLTDVLDVREVFDRISSVVQKVLPHDLLGFMEINETGDRVRVLAAAGVPDLPLGVEFEVPEPELFKQQWEYVMVDDVPAHPVFRRGLGAKFGMKSSLAIAIRFNGRLQAALVFFSRRLARFTRDDVPVAQRVARHFALVMSHERLAQEAHERQMADERATRLETRVRDLTEELDARGGYRRVIGSSIAWREVLKQATQVAATEATVLLLGETGTGKEVVARFIHRASARSDAAFVALNCAALPEHLLEAELFGYERGAFTGAMQSKPGQIEQASGGVLFLDEIGEMTLAAQAKFLRVLQEREFQRLGGNRVLRADIRVVAATNRDLQKAIERGLFREDLYYRINVFAIQLPPLRERPEDVLALSEAFLTEIGRSLGRPPSGISRDAREALTSYRWPGNVRELRNILERSAILAEGGLITTQHLGIGSAPVATVAAPRARSADGDGAATDGAARSGPPDLPTAERQLIEQAMKDARFNKSRAAKALGLTRAQLYVRLKRHGLE
jgi:transcriptional regulator with GAF, ATPase, and Fis domain